MKIVGDGNFNEIIPKFDGMLGAMTSISFSLFGYVYVLTRASFQHQSQNLIELGKNLGFSDKKRFLILFYLLQDQQLLQVYL